MYKFYIDNYYNEKLLSMINKIILNSKVDISEIRTNFPLHRLLSHIVKKYMISEQELVYYAIYLEKIGWIHPEYYIEEYLSLLAYTVKLYLNENLSILNDYINIKDPNFESKYSNYLIGLNIIDKINISPREVNLKHKELSKPSNIFCKKNYLDLNFIVDEVLAMSLPYSETKKDNDLNINIKKKLNIRNNKNKFKSKENTIIHENSNLSNENSSKQSKINESKINKKLNNKRTLDSNKNINNNNNNEINKSIIENNVLNNKYYNNIVENQNILHLKNSNNDVKEQQSIINENSNNIINTENNKSLLSLDKNNKSCIIKKTNDNSVCVHNFNNNEKVFKLNNNSDIDENV